MIRERAALRTTCIQVYYVYSMDSQLESIFKDHLLISQSFMIALLVWGVMNILLAIFRILAKKNVFFWQMTLMWNIVNIAIAGSGLLSANRNISFSPTFSTVITQLTQADSIIAFNLALNGSYLMIGLLLLQRGRWKESERLKGYSVAVLLQALFLLIFDSILLYTHSQLTRDLIQLLSSPAV